MQEATAAAAAGPWCLPPAVADLRHMWFQSPSLAPSARAETLQLRALRLLCLGGAQPSRGGLPRGWLWAPPCWSIKLPRWRGIPAGRLQATWGSRAAELWVSGESEPRALSADTGQNKHPADDPSGTVERPLVLSRRQSPRSPRIS